MLAIEGFTRKAEACSQSALVNHIFMLLDQLAYLGWVVELSRFVFGRDVCLDLDLNLFKLGYVVNLVEEC